METGGKAAWNLSSPRNAFFHVKIRMEWKLQSSSVTAELRYWVSPYSAFSSQEPAAEELEVWSLLPNPFLVSLRSALFWLITPPSSGMLLALERRAEFCTDFFIDC